ncbi:hypothetical protein E2C01_002011 [Portunus trituberculatus]|uniref:Uncharacterized protein n=1 Tax=Portunus trituberculatus TaxID=210409 RepID=A0A5B7CIR1_PORTR|nr:hypothetical protein [Portunus trituberculatus]
MHSLLWYTLHANSIEVRRCGGWCSRAGVRSVSGSSRGSLVAVSCRAVTRWRRRRWRRWCCFQAEFLLVESRSGPRQQHHRVRLSVGVAEKTHQRYQGFHVSRHCVRLASWPPGRHVRPRCDSSQKGWGENVHLAFEIFREI